MPDINSKSTYSLYHDDKFEFCMAILVRALYVYSDYDVKIFTSLVGIGASKIFFGGGQK